MSPEQFEDSMESDGLEPQTSISVTKPPMAEIQDGEFALVQEGEMQEIPLVEIRGEDLNKWIDEEMPHSD